MKTILLLAVVCGALPALASDCVHAPRAIDCWIEFTAPASATVTTEVVTCVKTTLPSGVAARGRINQTNACAATIQTGLGPLPVKGAYFGINARAGEVRIALTIEGFFRDYWGLPYVVLINPDGQPIAAKSEFGPEMAHTFTLPSSGQWGLLVTGVGGELSTPVGEYVFTAEYDSVPSKRRAVGR